MPFGDDEEDGTETPKLAWERRDDETKAAFDAFCVYNLLPPRQRSIDEAYRADGDQIRIKKRAPSGWFAWSQKYEWVKRANAYDEHLAEQDRLLWEERRRALREQDWSNADEARRLIMEALPEASRFIVRQERFVRGGDGEPDRLIITESFNIGELMRSLTAASKLQRLTTGDPTERTEVTDPTDARERILGRIAGIAERQREGQSPEGSDATGGAGA